MPDPVNLGFAMNLAPEKAIDYFRSKGYSISFRWQDTLKEAHAKAFTAAGAMKLDVLSELRSHVDQSLSEGKTFRQFKEGLEPELKRLGWLGKTEIVDPTTGELRQIDVNPYRLRNIYRTNLQTSYMSGRYQEQWSRRDRRPFWMYVAIIDESTRESHEAKNETVYPADDPVWNWMYPPNDWGCRCRVRSLSERRVEALGLKVHTGGSVKNFAGEGWDYNPGKAVSFDASNLSPELFPEQRNWKDFGLPDLRNIPDSQKLKADMVKRAKNVEDAHDRVGEVFGVSRENPVSFISSPVEDVAVNFENLRHPIEKRNEARERYANHARITIEDPLEIFLTLFPDGKYRKQYIGAFEGQNDILVSVIQGLDGSLLWNFFQATSKSMNKNRVGDALLYKKE